MRLSRFPESSVKTINITSALISTVNSVSQVTFTTSTDHNLTAGQLVTISGCTPTTFNISNVVISGIGSSNTFRVLVSSYAVAPTGTATGGLLNYNLAYVIPQYTTFTANYNNNTYNFYLNSESSPFTTLDSQVSDIVVQGTIVSNEAVGTSTGSSNQTFVLMKKNIDIDSITVQVQEGPISGGSPRLVSYQYVTNLSSTNYTEKVFTTRVKSDGYTQIIFGNGFNGSIPTTNSNIFAAYRTTDGSLGNLPANSIKLINGTPSSYVNIVSSSVTSGGADIESIASIKNNVSRLYRSQDRAVSLQDYKDLCLQLPGVSKATATYSNNVVTLYTVPHQTEYPPAPVTADGAQKIVVEIPTTMVESVESYFSTRSMVGVTAQVVNPTNHGTIDKYIECTPVYVGMKVFVRPNYVQSWVKDDVDVALRNLLTFPNTFFGQKLTVGEVYRAALSVQGVDYVELTTLDTNYDSTPATVGTVVDITANAYRLLCFSDEMDYPLLSVTNAPAISLAMYGGITGSN
jgi:predicted phage baseplate assembly protein